MKRGVSPILSRRGMSPLIATVLLMAFAVALGGMIMNWSVDAGKGSDCERIDIKVTQLCTKDDKIMLSMRNDPQSVQLLGIKLHLIDSGIDSDNKIKDSALPPGKPLDTIMRIAFGEDTQIQLFGIIGSEANPITCSEALVPSQPLKPCS